jgi:hypothetical protein
VNLKKVTIGHDLVQGEELGHLPVVVVHDRRELDMHVR